MLDIEYILDNYMFRIRAFIIHSAISVTVALLTIFLVFGIWHPSVLAKAIGVTHIFLMLLVIDATLGPLLTLIVAKEGKKTLIMDLAIIGILQMSAYLYGMYHIFEGRPTWIVFDTVRFELIAANAIDSSSTEVPAAYRYAPLLKPEWASVRPPANDKEKSERLFYELREGIPPAAQPSLYEPLSKAWSKIQEIVHPLAELEQYNPKSTVDKILDEYPEADGYIPLLAPDSDMTVLVNTKAQQVEKIVDLRPWD